MAGIGSVNTTTQGYSPAFKADTAAQNTEGQKPAAKPTSVDQTLKDWGYNQGTSKTTKIGIGAAIAAVIAAVALHNTKLANPTLQKFLGPVKTVVDKAFNFIKTKLPSLGGKVGEESAKTYQGNLKALPMYNPEAKAIEQAVGKAYDSAIEAMKKVV